MNTFSGLRGCAEGHLAHPVYWAQAGPRQPFTQTAVMWHIDTHKLARDP